MYGFFQDLSYISPYFVALCDDSWVVVKVLLCFVAKL